jgi:PBP1b-binding outer membrane lipoprotein LpoB
MMRKGVNYLKKISAIIAALAVVALFAFAGCQQQEAPKAPVQSTVTSTATATAPAAAPAAAVPAKK